MYKYPISVKERNNLNNINQLMKLVYSEFIVNAKGLIYPTRGGSLMNRGSHFMLTQASGLNDILSTVPSELYEGFELSTVEIYQTLRDNKKHIKHKYLKDNILGFCDDEEENTFAVAKALATRSLYMENQEKEFEQFYNHFTSVDAAYSLTEEDFAKLKDNELLAVTVDKFHVRLTKEIFPILSPKIEDYSLHFKHLDDNLFALFITYTTNGVSMYHQYKCVYF